jgi:hypothetical protein
LSRKVPIYWDKNGTRFWPVEIASPMLVPSRSLQSSRRRFCDQFEQGRKEGCSQRRESSVRAGAGGTSIGRRHKD